MIVLRNVTEVIGRGAHWDKIAREAIERKQQLENTDTFIAECGLGASGFPHIGSFADAARAYVVKVAVEDTGTFDAKFYAYADDLDGLRKVPEGLSDDLHYYIGTPVSQIPDYEECHQSYGDHMVSLLLGSLDEANIEYVHKSASKEYGKGVFSDQITTILQNSTIVGSIIEEETGQDKYQDLLPYHPICQNCGKIYTTQPIAADIERNKVSYYCDDAEISGSLIEGCGDSGEVDYTTNQGKLNWKVEFAARWSALKVDFEPYGKDIHESVLTTNRVSREILDYEPPYQVKYEMFLDKGGTKISKSKGNVFTPQTWFAYGSPQSLILMTLNRISGARTLGIEDIPHYMDELHDLEALYFGIRHESDKKTLVQQKAKYEYCWWLDPPDDHSLAVDEKGRFNMIPYKLISHLSKFCPPSMETEEFIHLQLQEYGLVSSDEDWDRLSTWFHYPINWGQRQESDNSIELDSLEREAISYLQEQFEKIDFEEDTIQKTVFNTIKQFELTARKFFPILYQLYLGIDHGPRIGSLIAMMDRETAISKLSLPG